MLVGLASLARGNSQVVLAALLEHLVSLKTLDLLKGSNLKRSFSASRFLQIFRFFIQVIIQFVEVTDKLFL